MPCAYAVAGSGCTGCLCAAVELVCGMTNSICSWPAYINCLCAADVSVCLLTDALSTCCGGPSLLVGIG